MLDTQEILWNQQQMIRKEKLSEILTKPQIPKTAKRHGDRANFGHDFKGIG